MRFVDKKLSFSQYVKNYRQERKKAKFFKDFCAFSSQHIKIYETKYLACFAFDGDTARLIIEGSPEKEQFDCILHYLKSKNMIEGSAIDAGANYGIHSISFSRLFKNVYSFEPHPLVFEILNFNAKQNNSRNNIHVYNLGLSSEKQILELHDHKSQNIGGSTFETAGIKNPAASLNYKCQVDTLDSALESITDNIGLIKIDTEGHEYKVLTGAQNLIQKHKPAILMEDWKSKNGVESDAIKFLKENGYKTFLIPTKYPQKRTASHKLDAMKIQVRYIWDIMRNGSQYGLAECDFLSPAGYDLILAHP